jgi:lipopolysaccharide cholinephosphotransferase
MPPTTELSLEEIKRVALDILQDVADFCERNSLRYFLAYGTLLGAVRHRGFIPWDDDIDICMPRSDYERFLQT